MGLWNTGFPAQDHAPSSPSLVIAPTPTPGSRHRSHRLRFPRERRIALRAFASCRIRSERSEPRAESGTTSKGTLIMKQQDLKALTAMAVDRAVAAREAGGMELTDEQIASVAGGAGSLSYIKDPTWYGIWEIPQTGQAGARLASSRSRSGSDRTRSSRQALPRAKSASEVCHVQRPRSDVPQRATALSGRGRVRRRHRLRRCAGHDSTDPGGARSPTSCSRWPHRCRRARCSASPPDASRAAAATGKATPSAAGWSRRPLRLHPSSVEKLKPCAIRSDCRWWQQEGKAACVRCPQVASSDPSRNGVMTLAASADYGQDRPVSSVSSA